MAYNPYYNSNPYFQQQPNFYGNGAMPDILNQQKMQYQQMPQQIMPTQADPMLWVLGQTEAESYPVAPNNTVTLWDKNNPTIYIKSANAQGVPSIRILDFVERVPNGSKTPEKHVCTCGDNFVTKERFKALESKFDEIKGIVDGMKTKTSRLTKGKDEE